MSKDFSQYRTIKDFMLGCYERSEIEDIADHGCSGGVPYLTYYSDTTSFYAQYQNEIWEMLSNDADDQGVNILELLASFNGANDVGNRDTFENLLAWYAAESVARQIVDNDEFDYSQLIEQMETFAKQYFDAIEEDHSTYEYAFDSESEELQIFIDKKLYYFVRKSIENFNGEKLEAFVLYKSPLVDPNMSDVYMLPMSGL